jgi:hypothetical protein
MENGVDYYFKFQAEPVEGFDDEIPFGCIFWQIHKSTFTLENGQRLLLNPPIGLRVERGKYVIDIKGDSRELGTYQRPNYEHKAELSIADVTLGKNETWEIWLRMGENPVLKVYGTALADTFYLPSDFAFLGFKDKSYLKAGLYAAMAQKQDRRQQAVNVMGGPFDMILNIGPLAMYKGFPGSGDPTGDPVNDEMEELREDVARLEAEVESLNAVILQKSQEVDQLRGENSVLKSENEEFDKVILSIRSILAETENP